MKMHKMMAAAIADESRPVGNNHDSDGEMACSPAVPENTRINAQTLTTTSTPN